MKTANVKGMVAKAMLVGVAAAALMFTGAPKAQAQGFAVGVQFGHPYYGYDRRGYEFERRQEFLRHEEFERRQAEIRHEEWLRAHRFDRPYGYR